MDFLFPGKHLHPLLLKGTVYIRIQHKLNNRVYQQEIQAEIESN